MLPPSFDDADNALYELGVELRDSGYRFVTVTPATHQLVNGRSENAWARSLRDVFGWSRPFRPERLPDRMLELMEQAKVLDRDGDVGRSRVRFSSCDGGLLVHSAFPSTAVDSVFLGPDTYRTIDATVRLLERREAPIRRAVDVGTGTGAVALAVAARVPDAEVLMVDINDTALRYARVNAALAGGNQPTGVHSDLLTAVSGEFDLIVSNPPFMIDPAARTYRDGGGPHGHDLPLAVLGAAVQRLAPGGEFLMFSGSGIVDGEDPLQAAVSERLDGSGLEVDYREFDPDVYDEELEGPAYRHAERIALVTVTVRRPD